MSFYRYEIKKEEFDEDNCDFADGGFSKIYYSGVLFEYKKKKIDLRRCTATEAERLIWKNTDAILVIPMRIDQYQFCFIWTSAQMVSERFGDLSGESLSKASSLLNELALKNENKFKNGLFEFAVHITDSDLVVSCATGFGSKSEAESAAKAEIENLNNTAAKIEDGSATLADIIAAKFGKLPDHLQPVYLKIKHDLVKRHVIDRLKKVQEVIESEDYDKIEGLISYSPAGDGYGGENHYIEFAYKSGESKDIEQICELLKSTKQIDQLLKSTKKGAPEWQ